MDNIQILYSKIVDNNSLDDIKKVMVDYNQMCELYDNMVEDLKIKERLVQSCKNVILDKLIKYRKEINEKKKKQMKNVWKEKSEGTFEPKVKKDITPKKTTTTK